MHKKTGCPALQNYIFAPTCPVKIYFYPSKSAKVLLGHFPSNANWILIMTADVLKFDDDDDDDDDDGGGVSV